MGTPTTAQIFRAGTMEEPLFLGGDTALCGRWIWQLKGEDLLLSSADRRLVVLLSAQRDARRFQRMESRVSSLGRLEQGTREPIPDDVKVFVWQRDQGRCVKCGTNENLEFDHIIPVIMGGSNSARNLQLQ